MDPARGAVFKQHLVNACITLGGCQVPLRALCGDGSQQAGLLGLLSWEKTAASASWLATFSLAPGLPWRLARLWLLSGLNPLQAACDGPATTRFLSVPSLLPSLLL